MTTHNGREIVGRKLEIRQTGGAFSADMDLVSPGWLDDYNVGDESTISMRLQYIDEHFPAENPKEPDEGGVYRKLVAVARETVLVDDDAVAPFFAAFGVDVQKAKDAAKGNVTVQESIADALEAAHLEGEHKTIVADCQMCDWEGELETAEAHADAEKETES